MVKAQTWTLNLRCNLIHWTNSDYYIRAPAESTHLKTSSSRATAKTLWIIIPSSVMCRSGALFRSRISGKYKTVNWYDFSFLIWSIEKKILKKRENCGEYEGVSLFVALESRSEVYDVSCVLQALYVYGVESRSSNARKYYDYL